MKIRTGFVSNSSSSSFLVVLKNKIKTIEDVKKLMKKLPKIIKYYEKIFTNEDVYKFIYNELKSSHCKNYKKKIIEEFVQDDDKTIPHCWYSKNKTIELHESLFVCNNKESDILNKLIADKTIKNIYEHPEYIKISTAIEKRRNKIIKNKEKNHWKLDEETFKVLSLGYDISNSWQECIEDYCFEHDMDRAEFYSKVESTLWDKWDDYCAMWAEEEYRLHEETFNNNEVYIFEVEDCSAIGSFVEQGDLFKKHIKNMRFSHH